MNGNANYKVVVAEDELPILENIIDKINSLDYPFTVVGSATNGEDAFALVEQLKPDILFTDIRMPVMDGFELIKQVVGLFPKIKIVIISGYSEFEYAQQAIRYGVTDYLLKPVRLANLKETSEKLYTALRQTSDLSEREIIASGLSGSTMQDLPSELSDKEFHMYLVCLGNLYDSCHNALNIEKINSLWSKINPQNILTSLFDDKIKWWLVDEKYPNCKIIITTCEADKLGEILFSSLNVPLENICSVTVCSTDTAITFNQIWKTAQQLRTRLHNNLIPCVSSYIVLDGQKDTGEIAEPDNKILSAIDIICRGRQLNLLQKEIAQLLSGWEQSHICQCGLEKFLAVIIKTIGEYGSDFDFAGAENKLYEVVANSISENKMYEEIYDTLCCYIFSIFQPYDCAEDLYLEIKQFIDNNYLSAITIDTISESFHFSASYISRIFKKYCGQPPMKYLLTLRINEAKRLILSNEGLNFCVISEMVGYSDSHYFSRIFKNTTGFSPSEYKSLHSLCKK